MNKQLCPILSQLVPPEGGARLLGVDGEVANKGEVVQVPCIGPACTFFLNERGQDGKPTGNGSCAHVLSAVMANQTAASMQVLNARLAKIEGVLASAIPLPKDKVN